MARSYGRRTKLHSKEWNLEAHNNTSWKEIDRFEVGFRTKYGADGEVLKLKACLVSKCYVQEYGVDFEEVFSPVARMETVRLLLVITAQQNWPVFHLDGKSAFLNGEINKEVYVEQPLGYEVQGKEEMVYRLRKALYGLKQALRAWYSKVDGFFLHLGFVRSLNEHSLYTKRDDHGILY